MEAIILAGGAGKRLRPLTDDIPKCMVKVNGRPLLDYQIKWLKKFGITRIIIACGYRWEKIKEYYKDDFVYSVEKEPLGTGGAIKKAIQKLNGDKFVLVNSDDFTNINIQNLLNFGTNSIVVTKLPSPYGVVELDGDSVKGFLQKPKLPHWVWCGVALLDKTIPLPNNGAIETYTFPKIKLKALKHEGLWMTVNTQKDLEELGKFLRRN